MITYHLQCRLQGSNAGRRGEKRALTIKPAGQPNQPLSVTEYGCDFPGQYLNYYAKTKEKQETWNVYNKYKVFWFFIFSNTLSSNKKFAIFVTGQDV